MFSPVDALFLEHKVHNSSSSLHLCTQKIIGHSELCKMARRCDQLTLKVVFTVCPAMLYPQTGNNFATKTSLELHDPPILSQPKLLCARNSRASTTFRRQDPAWKIEFVTILCLRYTLPPSTTLP